MLKTGQSRLRVHLDTSVWIITPTLLGELHYIICQFAIAGLKIALLPAHQPSRNSLAPSLLVPAPFPPAWSHALMPSSCLVAPIPDARLWTTYVSHVFLVCCHPWTFRSRDPSFHVLATAAIIIFFSREEEGREDWGRFVICPSFEQGTPSPPYPAWSLS